MLQERMTVLLPPVITLLGVSFAFSNTSFSLTDVAIVFAAGLVFIDWFRKHDWYWPLHRKAQRVALYFAAIIVLGIIFLPFDDIAFGLITLYLVGVYFVARYATHLGYRSTILKLYTVGAFFSALYGITWWLWVHEVGERYRFFFDDPNVYGAFLVPATLFFMWRVLAKDTMVGYRTLNLLGASVLYSALLLTLSRGAWLQAGISLGIVLLIMFFTKQFDRASYKVLGSGVVVILIGGLLMSGTLTEHMLKRQSNSDYHRIENYSYALETISQFSTHRFIVGYGNGSYEQFSIDAFAAHNTYIRLLFENGFLGLGLFGFLIVGAVFKNRREFHKPDIAILLASLAGILVHGLFIDTLHWRHLWLILGLL